MSIEDRLRDVRVLYDRGRFDGAMLSAMIATAATSRLRYPRPSHLDSFAFRTFLDEELPGCCEISYEGRSFSLGEFLYRWVRNSLAHEGVLPATIVFHAPESPLSARIRFECTGAAEVVMDHTMILLIAHSVASAPENANIASEVKLMLRPTDEGSELTA